MSDRINKHTTMSFVLIEEVGHTGILSTWSLRTHMLNRHQSPTYGFHVECVHVCTHTENCAYEYTWP